MTFTTPTEPVPAATSWTGTVSDLTRAVALVGGLRGALRSGMIEALSRWQPCTSIELATRAHLPPHTVELVLDALSVGGVVVRHGSEWSLTAPLATWVEFASLVDRIGELVETAPRSADDGDGDDRHDHELTQLLITLNNHQPTGNDESDPQ